MQNFIENYTLYVKNGLDRSFSSNTLSSYISDLMQFQKFYENTKKSLQELNQTDIVQFKNFLKNYKNPRNNDILSINTINRKLIALNNFLKYLSSQEKMNFSVQITNEKVQYQNILGDMLSNEDVSRILRAVERKKDLRAKAIIYTLFFTGARVSEILQIKVRDIGKDEIWIKGKGDKYRKLFIPKKLTSILREYEKERLDSSFEGFLFTGQKGAITRQKVAQELKYYAGMARLKKSKVHAHAFRHLYTKNIYDLGVNPAVVKQLLGHSLGITEIYMQVSKKDLLRAINKLYIEF